MIVVLAGIIWVILKSPDAYWYSAIGMTLHCAPVSTWNRTKFDDSNLSVTSCESSRLPTSRNLRRKTSSGFSSSMTWTCLRICLVLALQLRHLTAKWFGFRHLLHTLPYAGYSSLLYRSCFQPQFPYSRTGLLTAMVLSAGCDTEIFVGGGTSTNLGLINYS